MRSRMFLAPVNLILLLTVVSLVFVTCSEDDKCPTCPTCPTLTQWVAYDNFSDNTLDTVLWNYIPDC